MGLLTGIYSPISSVIFCSFSRYFSTSPSVFLEEKKYFSEVQHQAIEFGASPEDW
jgi:hypothetical protein